MLRFLLAGAVALAVASCAWDNGKQLETPVDGYPCGVAGVVCYDTGASGALAPTGMCCNQGEVCGGGFPNIGCPVGACCYEGADGVSRDGTRPGPVAPIHPQTPAAR